MTNNMHWPICLMLASLLLNACSGENTTTLLDIENPAINLNVPQPIADALDDGIFNSTLRPEVTVNDAVVSVNRGFGDQWSGTINLPANALYDVTVIWVEQYEGIRLELAKRVAQILVAADGSASETSESEADYSYGFDTDNDTLDNFTERTDNDPNTDPLVQD